MQCLKTFLSSLTIYYRNGIKSKFLSISVFLLIIEFDWGTFIKDVIYFLRFLTPPPPSSSLLLNKLVKKDHLLTNPLPLNNWWRLLWTAPWFNVKIRQIVDSFGVMFLSWFKIGTCFLEMVFSFLQKLMVKKWKAIKIPGFAPLSFSLTIYNGIESVKPILFSISSFFVNSTSSVNNTQTNIWFSTNLYEFGQNWLK